VDRYFDRACPPEETLRRVEPYLARFGITRLARLTGLDGIGIPVWNAVSPNAQSIVINQGKGITDLDAKVSAAMEALERSIACSPMLDRRSATYRRLMEEGERADRLPGLLAVGKPDLGQDETTEWVSGFDLIGKARIWVPFEAVSLDRTKPDPRYWQSSDGLASGNTQTEAILHGLLERIERDAYVLWSVSSRPARHGSCVDPRSLGDTLIDGLMEKIENAGLQLMLFDMTSDVGISSFMAVLADEDILAKKTPLFHDVTIGHGAHPSAYRAVIRAITEAAQSRLTYISGARDDVFAETYRRPLPSDTLDLFRAEIHPARPGNEDMLVTPEELLDFLVERLATVGVRSVIGVPLDGNELPFYVIKMLVPDLENPDGKRKHRLGPRALSKSLELA
jgi:ribosomal protein S12 methylthiotransferase accessory factor